MSDYLVRILAKEAGVRGLACVTTTLVHDAAARHTASPVATAALGHGLTAAALLGALLKIQQRVAIKVEGDGPLGKLIVEGNSYGRVRGYVSRPEATLDVPLPANNNNVGLALGHRGLLTVVRDEGMKEQLYQGIVPLQTGQLDSDLVYYFMQSEQVPTLIEIGTKLSPTGELQTAGGLLLQLLPGAELATLRALAEKLDDMPDFAEQLVHGDSPEEILAALFGRIPYEILEIRPLQFQCSCSWARSEQALLMLGSEDLQQLMVEGQAVVDCHFCHQRYIFGVEALETILEKTK